MKRDALPENECSLERIADSGLGHVGLCPDCAAIHVTVQCLTLRLDPKAFLELVGMVLQARHRLSEIANAASDESGSSKPRRGLPGALH